MSAHSRTFHSAVMTYSRPDHDEYPLFRLRGDGSMERLGQVVPMPGDAFHVQVKAERPTLVCPPDGGDAGMFPGLPWYLDDLRPQGFLGRAYARRHTHALGLPLDRGHSHPRSLMKMLSRTGGTGQGDIVPGEAALRAALLEVQRFDRTPNLLGRRGFVSLMSLSVALVGGM